MAATSPHSGTPSSARYRDMCRRMVGTLRDADVLVHDIFDSLLGSLGSGLAEVKQ